MERKPLVFISYGREPEIDKAVRDLATSLLSANIDCIYDQGEKDVPPFWTKWMQEHIQKADFVLIVGSKKYHDAVLNAQVGRGVYWESAMITVEMYAGTPNKFIPIVFSPEDLKYIPAFLADTTRYDLSEQNQRQQLFDRLAAGRGRALAPNKGDSLHSAILPESYFGWELLHKIRHYGNDRRRCIAELDDWLQSRTKNAPTNEILALQELLLIEKDRASDIYRLNQALAMLDSALKEKAKQPGEEYLEIEWVNELLNLFVIGSEPPEERSGILENVIGRVGLLLKRTLTSLQRIRTMLLLAEAYKEKAMISRDIHVSSDCWNKSRTLCISVLELLKSENLLENQFFLGVAYRHLAVTYELEGDEKRSKDEMRRAYEAWRAYSDDADLHLRKIKETRVRAFALINSASAHTRLAELEYVLNDKAAKLLDEGEKKVVTASQLFESVDEHRGLGWAYIHYCDNMLTRIKLAGKAEIPQEILASLETAASKAVHRLKLTADSLALGLAYEQLGIVLKRRAQLTSDNALGNVLISRAIRVFDDAIKRLKDTGFHTAAVRSCFLQAECYFEIFNRRKTEDQIVAAIRSLVEGLLNVGNLEDLSSIYPTLRDRLQTLLSREPAV